VPGVASLPHRRYKLSALSPDGPRGRVESALPGAAVYCSEELCCDEGARLSLAEPGMARIEIDVPAPPETVPDTTVHPIPERGR
jgi:hypothetical protein